MHNQYTSMTSANHFQSLTLSNNSFSSSLSSSQSDAPKVAEANMSRPSNKVPVKSSKSYPCTYCFKCFNRPSALKTHMYTHTDEKPFQCLSPDCGRKFSVVSNLRRHLKVHQRVVENNNNSQRITAKVRLQRVRQLIDRSKQKTVSTKESNQNHFQNKYILPYYAKDPNHISSEPIRHQSAYVLSHYLLLPPILADDKCNSFMTNNATPCSTTITREKDLPSMTAKFVSVANNKNSDSDSGGNREDISNNSLFSEADFLYLYTNQVLVDDHTSYGKLQFQSKI